LDALKRIDYAHFVSVKIYRTTAWAEAARAAMAYLKQLSWPDTR
jgi:hypothetical protein